MRKSSKTKVTNIDRGVQIFWELKRQWNGQSNTSYTVADTNALLNTVRALPNCPPELHRQSIEFQHEVVCASRRLTKSHAVSNPNTVVTLSAYKR